MKQTIERLKALADRNRFRIVASLRSYDELCACQITELLQVTGATASRHLGLLVNAGLVDSRKEGRWVYYKLNTTAAQSLLLQWIDEQIAGAADIEADILALQKITGIDREELCRMQRGEVCCPK